MLTEIKRLVVKLRLAAYGYADDYMEDEIHWYLMDLAKYFRSLGWSDEYNSVCYAIEQICEWGNYDRALSFVTGIL